ncbi:hypothetical protein BRC2024_OQYPJBKP_CDS_0040 [Acinetobacter phage vB_AbaM_Highwayman]
MLKSIGVLFYLNYFRFTIENYIQEWYDLIIQ